MKSKTADRYEKFVNLYLYRYHLLPISGSVYVKRWRRNCPVAWLRNMSYNCVMDLLREGVYEYVGMEEAEKGIRNCRGVCAK